MAVKGRSGQWVWGSRGGASGIGANLCRWHGLRRYPIISLSPSVLPWLLLAGLSAPAAAQTPTTVTVSADATVVTEGEAVVFTLTATPALDAALSVPVAVSEKAPGRTGRDFVAWAQEKTHTVSIPASGTATLTIPTVRDGFDEPEGLVTAALRPGGGYAVGDPSSASVAVADDDGPPPPTAQVSIIGGSPLPEGAAISFTLALSRSLATDETVTLPLAIGGTATRGTDYRLTCAAGAAFTCNGLDGAGPSITFHGAILDGRHRVSDKMWLEAIEDGTVESNETLTLQLGGGRTTTITLKDAPSSVTLSFFRGDFYGPEGGGLFQPVLRVDAAPGADIPVTLVYTDTTDTTDLTATAGADYVKEATVTYSADGKTRSSIDIPILEDALCEGDETFRVAIDASSLPSWVTVGSQGSAVMTLEDNDCTATVSGVSDAQEGASAQFAVHVTPAPVRDMDIGYAVSEDAGNSRQFVAAGNKGGGRTVTVRANEPSVGVTVPTVQAAGADADGRVTVTLESGNQYTLGSPSSTSVRVFDDQYEADHVTFTGVAGSAKGPLYNSSAFGSGTFEVNEGVGAIWVELELSQTPKSQTTVYVRERGSGTTATRGADYQRPPYGWTANFGAGRKGRARFKVLIVDDGIDDDRETLTLDIYEVSNAHGDFRPDTAGHGANTGPLGTYEITIRDYTSSASGDDVWVWLSADVYEVAEGGTLEAAVHLEEARGVDTVISVTEMRGTATEGADYTAGPYSVTVPAGGTMGTFTIQTAEDTELEMDETFRIRIDDASLPAGFGTPDGVGMPEEARVTINDDEYTFCFDQRSYSVREGEELAANIQFSRPLPEGGWFKFTYSDRNATSGEDYTQVNAFPDSFWLPAGTEQYTLRIPFAEDTLYEGNELFHVQADVPALPDGHTGCSVDVVIRDNSREVDFVVAAYTAHEGRAAEVAVRVVERDRDNPLKLRKPVTLHVADSGTGTATSGTDYAAGPWTLTIPAGASRGVLRIPVHADSASDDGETIDLAIRRAGTGTSESDRQLLGADGAVSSDNLHVRVRDVTDMANGAATVTIQGASGASSWKPFVWIEAGPQVSEGNDATFTLKTEPAPLAPLDVSVHVGETDVSHDLNDPFSGIRRHLAEEDRGLGIATVDTTGSTVFTVPTRTNGAANTSAVRVVLMDPSLLFGDGEADYTVGRPDAAYVGVDTAAPEFEAQRSEESAVAVAPTEPVRNLRVTAVDATSAQASWDAVPHATAYRLEWEGGSGGDYIGGGSNGVTGTTETIYHNAPAAMTLTVRVTPWHVDDDGEVQEHDALAATATLDVGPVDPLAAAVKECRGSLESDIQGYIGEQADGTPHVTRWKKVLAAFGTDNGYTKMTAAEAQTHADRGWSRWDPVVVALQCIEKAEEKARAASGPVISIAGGGGVAEGAAASFTVTADPAPAAPLTVDLAISQSGDFAASGETGVRQVTVPTGGSVTINVATVDDAVLEADGAISATVAAGTGYAAAAAPNDAASVAVADNDTPVVRVAAGNDVTEGSSASFTVTADPAPQADLTVTLAVTQSGDFAASGQTGTREVVVPTGGSATFDIATVNDTADEPDGSVTAVVSAGTGYRVASSPDDTASVTVADDDAAPAVPEFTIGDVTANEDDRFMWFTVTLSMASNRTLQVSYRTRESNPVSARANSDFLQVSFGTLTFSPGETSKRFWVYIFNDSHDEGSETFQAVLSSPTGGAVITDGVAVGTILNDDPLPKAWHLRFGRTVSQQVVDALQNRFSSPAPLETGLQLAFAGENFTSDTPLAENQGLLSKALGFENVSHQLLVEGSSFSFAPQGEAGPQFALWGQGALSSFSGQEEEVSLDGDVTTLLLGADWSAGRWLAGAALSHSWANGSYDGEDDADGEISTSLTGLFPYGRYVLSPRLNLWATAGYGWGALSLKPDGNGEEYKPDTTMTMVALGMDGLLLDGGSEGLSLNTTADLLSLNATSDKVEGLESSEGNVSRLRLGLEATRPFPFANGSSLLPSMEVGIRQDGGDAETGFGMDLGAGIAWKDPQRGISGELKGRTLLSHAEEDFHDQGLALSFSWDPSPSNRGPSLSMGHAMGVVESGGLDALLHPTTFEQMDGTTSNGQRFEAELAYGFPVHNDRLTLTPAVAMALSPTSRNYGLLWSLAPYTEQLETDPWQFSIEAERQEHTSPSTPTDHSLKLRFSTLL